MHKFRLGVLGGAKGGGDRFDSIAGARGAQRGADRRGGDRHRLAREIATITYRGRTIEVDLVNLSGGGAMIEADISPRLWDRVDLHLGEGSPIECAVRWLRGGRIGLEFAHETQLHCALETRDAVLLDVIRRSFPDLAAPRTKPPADEQAVVKAAVPTTRRADLRHPLIWNGTILWRHDVHSARLRNISASGALIDSQVDFPEGAELMLDLGDSGQYFATVGWSRSGQAGLCFAEPFDLAVLAAARPDLAPRRWDKPTYLDLSSGQTSPWASECARHDLTELQNKLEGFLRH